MRIITSLLRRNGSRFSCNRIQRNAMQLYSTSTMILRRNNPKGSNVLRETGFTSEHITEEVHAHEQQHVNFDRDILNELQTIQDVYRFAVTLYNKSELSYGHTTINAFDDASFLIMHELHLPIQDPVTQWGTSRLTRQEREHLLNLIHLRASSKTPTAYLVKGCYQQGEYFHIDERALIPRSYLGEIMMSKRLHIVGSNAAPADSSSSSSNSSSITSAYKTPHSSSGNKNSGVLSSDSSSSGSCQELDYDDYFGGGGSGEGEDDEDKDDNDEEEMTTDTGGLAERAAERSTASPDQPQRMMMQPHNNKAQAGTLSVAQQLDALYRRSKPQFLINTDKVHSVLDLCTGSGCLAILATKAFPLVERVDAVDISSDALEVAEANVDLHGAEDVLTLYHGDLYAPLHEDDDYSSSTEEGHSTSSEGGGPRYDLIMANPPYVSDELMEELPEEYTREPALALAAGHDGLEVIRKIMMHAHSHLNDGGGLLCEIGQCKQELMQAFPKLFGSVFYDDCDKPGGANDEGDADNVKFIHDGSSSRQKVHWIATECSTDEVFYVEKRYLTQKYLL